MFSIEDNLAFFNSVFKFIMYIIPHVSWNNFFAVPLMFTVISVTILYVFEL